MDRLVDLVETDNAGVPTGDGLSAIELSGECGVQDVVDEGRLARTGNTGDGNETAKRKTDIDIAQVVLAGALDHKQSFRVTRPPDGRHLDLASAEIGRASCR